MAKIMNSQELEYLNGIVNKIMDDMLLDENPDKSLLG